MQMSCNAPPSASPCQSTSTMCGWLARASSAGSGVTRVETFTTTSRSSRSACSARKTRAKAPRPSSRIRRYGPISLPTSGKGAAAAGPSQSRSPDEPSTASTRKSRPSASACVGEPRQVVVGAGVEAGPPGQAELAVDQLDPLGRLVGAQSV